MTVPSTATPAPTTPPSLTGVVAVAAGLNHSLALKDDGSVWSWGQNASGQLGTNTTADAKQAAQLTALAGQSITAIVSGHNHSLALRSDGAVYAWGANGSGQLGDGKTSNLKAPVLVPALGNAVAVAAGAKHSLVLRNDGTVWGWGANNAGQLGDGTTTNRTAPVQVSGLSGMLAIAANGEHSFALRNDGTVWAWGSNSVGQLGDGTTTNRTMPRLVANLVGVTAIAAGTSHGVALRVIGDVLAWGSNWTGQLGDGSRTDRASPVATLHPTQTGSLMLTDGQGAYTMAVEYFLPSLGHYFLTADPFEIDLLDRMPAGGWVRTGASFRVSPIGATAYGALPVCRFFSQQAVSHFYTADAAECTFVREAAPDYWLYEGTAFHAIRPVNGACATGSPVYRAYNNRPGPNHRYATDPSSLEPLLAQGWVAEGTVMCTTP